MGRGCRRRRWWGAGRLKKLGLEFRLKGYQDKGVHTPAEKVSADRTVRGYSNRAKHEKSCMC